MSKRSQGVFSGAKTLLSYAKKVHAHSPPIRELAGHDEVAVVGTPFRQKSSRMSRWPMALRGKKSSDIARSSNGKRFRLALTLPRHRAITRLFRCCEISHRASVRPSSQSSASLANSAFTSSALKYVGSKSSLTH